MWKILDVVKCQTWRHFRCGEILDVCKFVWFHELLALACQANRWYKSHRFAARYLLMKFTVICRIFCFIVINAVLSQNFFCRNLHTFCVEKNYTQNFVRGEKMTNIMYGHTLLFIWISVWQKFIFPSTPHFFLHGFTKPLTDSPAKVVKIWPSVYRWSKIYHLLRWEVGGYSVSERPFQQTMAPTAQRLARVLSDQEKGKEREQD